MSLQRFKRLNYFNLIANMCFTAITTLGAAYLVCLSIAKELKSVRRQKPLFRFLTKCFESFITESASIAKGIKIQVKGRLNGAPRARHKIICVGKVPVQSIAVNISYYQTMVHNSNGSYGIKVWVCY